MRVANQLSGVTRRTVVAMALALAGVTLMLGAPNEGSLAGDGLSFVAALAFALMIVITRWRHDVSMAPATCVSRGILVAAFLPFASPGEIGGDDFIWLARLGIGQIGLGFALLTVGARLIPAAQVQTPAGGCRCCGALSPQGRPVRRRVKTTLARREP
jgi:drug/metabolite transporter (DMT)-like permease